MTDWISIAKSKPVCSIGQLDSAAVKALTAAVRKGELVKRQAPFAGNIGAIKTYYAANNETFDAYQAEQVRKFETYRLMDEFNR